MKKWYNSAVIKILILVLSISAMIFLIEGNDSVFFNLVSGLFLGFISFGILKFLINAILYGELRVKPKSGRSMIIKKESNKFIFLLVLFLCMIMFLFFLLFFLQFLNNLTTLLTSIVFLILLSRIIGLKRKKS